MDKLSKLFGRNFFFGIFAAISIFIILVIFFKDSINNYFIADDFTWLRWASGSNASILIKNFYDSSGFFYRPIDKLLIFFAFKIFAYQPLGYHLISISLHYTISLLVLLVFNSIFKKKSLAFLGALFFALTPVHEQNIFWFSTFSITLSSLFVLWSLVFYFLFKTKKNIFYLIVSIFISLLAVFSYEGAAIIFLLIPLVDLLLSKKVWINLKFYIPYFLVSVLYLNLRTIAGSAGFSGDYNYNFIKLIPNFVGNFFGYIFMFLFGSNSISIYSLLRVSLKNYTIPISIIGLFCLFLFFLKRKEFYKLFQKYSFEVFGLYFAFVALLPFLGLGNITDRYLYLSSFGFILTTLALLERYVLSKLKNPGGLIVYCLIIIVSSIWFYKEFKQIEYHWIKASKITNSTVLYLKTNFPLLPKNSSLYFVNVPIKYGQAYVFPVGLEDAVWSVYKDNSIKVYQVNSFAEAKKPYVLEYGSNFEITKFKQ